ncbi:MAG TPA: M13 family metallopeptidase [Thermoanaerobaculia bacterium]
MTRRSPLPPIVALLAIFAVAAATGALAQPPADKIPPSAQPVLDLASMDAHVDPCVDFYTYSCGGWMKKNPIPADRSSWSAYSKLQEETNDTLRQLLERAAASPGGDADRKKIGDYYAACMDEKAVEAKGAAPLAPGLARIAALRSKADLAELLAGLQLDDDASGRGGSTLFRFGSVQDFRDATKVVANADQGGLGLPDRDFYLKTDAKSAELRKAYLAHVQRMLELAGDPPAGAAAAARTVMAIETALARVSLARVERRDPKKLDHTLTRERLAALAPDFAWDRYFAKLGLAGPASLNVTHPAFFAGLSAEIRQVDLAGWKSYLRWHLIHAQAQYLSPPFVQANFDFYDKRLTGAQELRPRWKRCVAFVDRDLGEALGKVYVEERFSPEAKARALEMVHQIEAAMGERIRAADWMSPETRRGALEKLAATGNKIGYPDHWRDYGALAVARDDFAGNVSRGLGFELRRDLAKIGKPVDRGEWQMTPPTVNAYNDPQLNDINFPAGVLQPPVFDVRSDDAPNYGDTGGTIGHELTHSFDDEGRQFDAHGNLHDWWTPEDAKRYVERAACISDQYSRYTVVDSIKLNGKLTLGEDVADLGGLIIAHLAWREQTKGQDLKPIDGLTPEQRFFIGYGQSWCTNERDEQKRLRATVDPHSPERYRTNGVVANVPEFVAAFQCKAGSPMVSQRVCRVW